jgi:hypothetical protein
MLGTAPSGLQATTTTLSISSSTIDPNTVVTLTTKVAVSGNAGITPHGIVYLYEGADNIGAGMLDDTGQFTLYVNGNNFLQGSGQLTAQYLGDGTALAPSTSAPITINADGGDFSITANTQLLAITSGQSGSTTLQLGSMLGMTGTAKMTCATSSKYLTCSFNPASVTLSATANATTTLTVNTQTTVTPTSSASNQGLKFGGGETTGCVALAGLLLVGRRRRRVLNSLIALVMFAALGLGLTGCGGSAKPPTPQPVNAPAGNYTVLVTGTVGGVAHNLQVQVVVQ